MSLYELNQRYAEIALRDDVGFVATINPITLETGFTPQSLVDVTALLSSTDRRKDWDRLADEAAKYCDDIEGIGLLQSIDQARSGLELLQAQAAGNAPAIDQAQRSLYGHMYSDGLFVRAAHDALDHIGQLDPKRQPEAYQSAQAAREMLEDVVEGQLRSAIQTTLTPATRAEVALWVEDKLGHVFEAIDNSARFPPPAVVTELQRAITLLPQFEGTDWRAAEVTRASSSVMSESLKQLVSVSTTLPHVSGKKVKELQTHEVLIHSGRSALGAKAGSPLAEHGTASYAEIEESACILTQSTPFPEQSVGLPGVINYLGVGFACGALHKSFSRQETLKLVSGVWRTIFAVREGRDFTQEELAKREASERGVLANIYNGVPLETEGLAQMSYLKYFYGLERAALLMNTMASFGIVDSGLNWLHSTKTNPYDPVDLAIASRYYKPPQILKEWLLENSKQPRGPGN